MGENQKILHAIEQEQNEMKMIVIWILTIQTSYIIFLIALMSYSENLAIYIAKWAIHAAVFICLGLLRWTKVNSRNLQKLIMLLLHARIILSIVQKQNMLSIEDKQALLSTALMGSLMFSSGVMNSFLISYLFYDH